MAWSKWQKALVVALACFGLARGGLVWSQTVPSAPATPMGNAERIMTVVENGNPLSCRVLKTWRQANGTLAYQLEAIDTKEILTIEEAAPSFTQEVNGRKGMAMRIFHWGANKTPPPGAPVPPPGHTPIVKSGWGSRLFARDHHRGHSEQAQAMPAQGCVQIACDPCAAQLAPPQGQGAVPASLAQGPSGTQQVLVTAPVSYSSGPSGGQAGTMEMAPLRTSSPQPRGLFVVLRNFFHPRHQRVATGRPTTTGYTMRAIMPAAVTPPLSQQPAACEAVPQQRSACTQQPSPAVQQVSQSSSPPPAVATNQAPPACPGKASPANSCREPFPTAVNGPAPPVTVLEKNQIKTVAEPSSTPATKETQAAVTPKGQPGVPRRGFLQNMWQRMFPSQATCSTTAPPHCQPSVANFGKETQASLPAVSVTQQRRDILTAPERLRPVAAAKVGQDSGRSGPNGHQPLPPGAQSVMAANNGLQQGITYVPVPMVTVPQPLRPPSAPEPRLPPPPPGTVYQNAFSQPVKQHHAPAAHGQGNVQQVVYPAACSCQPHPQGGYGFAPAPAACPTGCCSTGGCSLGFCASTCCQPGACPSCPPYVHQLCQASCQGNCPTGLATHPNPAMDRPGLTLVPGGSILAQVISVLRESPYPAQREWAANTLATYDWRTQPQVLSALLNAAQHDPAASVRASCAFSLARMNANIELVRATMRTLGNDPDPRVRHEAEQALQRLGTVQTSN